MAFTVPSTAAMTSHHLATQCSSHHHHHHNVMSHQHQLYMSSQSVCHPPQCVMGIPLSMAGPPSRRRNSFSHSRNSRYQSSVARAFISDGEFEECRQGPEEITGNDKESEEQEKLLRATRHELSQIEQQMMIMMGQRPDEDDDVLSVGSSDEHVLGKENAEFHQDLSAAVAGKHSPCYSSSFVSSRSPIDDQMHCFVILFGMGSEETEGIYTLRTVEYEDGDVVNVDTVVAFASEVDAQRFATLLEASLRHEPAVYSTSWADIREWCAENNAKCRLEQEGSLMIPPESNVSVTDWERALALQRGEFSVLEEEPNRDVLFSEDDDEMAVFSMEGVDEGLSHDSKMELDNVSNIVDSRMANASLNSVREELERLLGNSL